MGKIAIVTDSNSGITQKEGKELGISVIPMPFYINEELYFEDITLTQDTGVCVIEDGKTKTFYEETKVTFYEISDEQIDRYIKTGEPMDKAGSYGIQGKAAVFIKGIEGDYYNVVGFPIARFLQEITK